MLIIGLAGGIASGKSFVAEQFQLLGAKVLDADILGHEVLKDDQVIDEMVRAFGSAVLDSHGALDRKMIAARVFSDGASQGSNLEILEQITHPRISKLIRTQLDQWRAEGVAAAVVDAAVMFKAGWDQYCDKIVYVKVDRQARLARALKRGWTEEHFAEREAAQTPLEVKRQRATDVIDNNGDSKETNQQTKQLWEKWNLPLPKNHEVPTKA